MKLHVYITPPASERLVKLAETNKRSASQEAQIAVEKHVTKPKTRKLKYK